MKIQLVSDLHLEFGSIRIDNAGADVLVLSGDICVAEHWTTTDHYFFEHVCGEFSNVVYVLGNHEHYNGDFTRSYTHLKNTLSRYSNLAILDVDSVGIDGVLFVGGTLWTDAGNDNPIKKNMMQREMNDFIKVTNGINEETNRLMWFSPDDAVAYHRRMVKYVEETYNNEANGQNRPIVVVGHHAPSYQSVSEEYKGDPLNAAYASELFDFIADRPNIRLWTHGHMHSSSDYMIGSTRVICNPRGYHRYAVNDNFNPNLVIEV